MKTYFITGVAGFIGSNLAKKIMDEKLGDYKIMALASCVDDYPMVRNVSCVFYNDKIYFKTDKNFRKTQQLSAISMRVIQKKLNVQCKII